tara:strand:+ start:46 stop:984 length:939 start_codon:yes stop_codon:yes gene_type:complete
VSSNNLFPRKSDLFGGPGNRKSMRDLTPLIGRPSLDTLYQVSFSFGNFEKWLGESDLVAGSSRTQGTTFMNKMAIMCTEAEIPGTAFQTSLAVGHHQGIQEEFPNLRSFPPLNLTFYVDADHVVIEVLETWMTYINPITNNKRNLNAYGRFNYPEDYKEIIHITKFERDSFLEGNTTRTNRQRDFDDPDNNVFGTNIFVEETPTKLLSYEFVNCWPTNMTSMRVAYGQSNVLRCSVQLAYDRYFTNYNYDQTNNAVEESFFDQLSNKEQKALYDLNRKENSYLHQYIANMPEGGYTGLNKEDFSEYLSEENK